MMEGDRPKPKNVLDRLKAKADRDPHPTPAPVPALVLDWEKRCRELELMIEEHSRLIVDLKEELHQQDERIKKLNERLFGEEKQTWRTIG